MRVRHLREPDYRRMRWKNGGGWTTELAVSPAGDGDHFDWRISIAEIESDGAFSTFPHCERYIALLDGNGMTLEFDAAPTTVLDQRLRFVHFSGEWQTRGRLHDGPVRDFNVIARRDRVRVDVLHRPLVGSMVFTSQARTSWFVYLAAGRATLKHPGGNAQLSAGESVLLDPDEAGGTCILDGGGELVLVKLDPLSGTPTVNR